MYLQEGTFGPRDVVFYNYIFYYHGKFVAQKDGKMTSVGTFFSHVCGEDSAISLDE